MPLPGINARPLRLDLPGPPWPHHHSSPGPKMRPKTLEESPWQGIGASPGTPPIRAAGPNWRSSQPLATYRLAHEYTSTRRPLFGMSVKHCDLPNECRGFDHHRRTPARGPSARCPRGYHKTLRRTRCGRSEWSGWLSSQVHRLVQLAEAECRGQPFQRLQRDRVLASSAAKPAEDHATDAALR
jgi:hypothetical protein